MEIQLNNVAILNKLLARVSQLDDVIEAKDFQAKYKRSFFIKILQDQI